MNPSKLTIAIPCYNQTELLRRCLNSLQEQTFKDFTVHIIDDHSSENYQAVISEFPNLSITYSRNEVNLGAIGNIFNSITLPTQTPYLLSLHEDDSLHLDYLHIAVEILDENPNAVFVGSPMEWFKTDDELKNKKATEKKILDEGYKILNKKGFVMEMLKGVHFCFGSIVYRSNITPGTKPDLEEFDVLCDRPYLANLIGEKECAIINDCGIYVRSLDAKNDHRGDNITSTDIKNLAHFYKQFAETKKEKALFYKHMTNNIIYGYHRLTQKDVSFMNYLNTMKKEELVNYLYLNPQGILGLWKGFISK